MQLSMLFSALISFVILAAASPTPRAISIEKLSSKRQELDTNSEIEVLLEGGELDELEAVNSLNFDDILEGPVIAEGIGKKREELDTNTIIYAWYDGPGDKKRGELETKLVEYYQYEKLGSAIDYVGREELETKFVDYHEREELGSAIDYVG